MVKNVKGLTLLFHKKMPVFRNRSYCEKFHRFNLTFSQKDACF